MILAPQLGLLCCTFQNKKSFYMFLLSKVAEIQGSFESYSIHQATLCYFPPWITNPWLFISFPFLLSLSSFATLWPFPDPYAPLLLLPLLLRQRPESPRWAQSLTLWGLPCFNHLSDKILFHLCSNFVLFVCVSVAHRCDYTYIFT